MARRRRDSDLGKLLALRRRSRRSRDRARRRERSITGSEARCAPVRYNTALTPRAARRNTRSGHRSRSMTLAPGTRIADYTVLKKLGEGGMGEVYLCVHAKAG